MHLAQSLAAAITVLHPRIEAPRAEAFASYIVSASVEHGVSPWIVLVRISVESDFRPWAFGAAGEIGLGQIMPETATALWPGRGLDYVVGRLRDQKDNVKATAWFLAKVQAECKGGEDPLMWANRYRGRAVGCKVRPGSRFALRWAAIKHLREATA